MDKKEIWTFKYKGFNCSIAHWGSAEMRERGAIQPGGIWNSYIIIQKKQLPKQFRKLLCKFKVSGLPSKRKFWDYYKLENYFDMHGGLTYYEPLRDEFTGDIIAVKVGCDYAHAFDDEYSYNVDMVKRDLEKSVDKFIEAFPDYLVWRISDGKYVKPGIEESQ